MPCTGLAMMKSRCCLQGRVSLCIVAAASDQALLSPAARGEVLARCACDVPLTIASTLRCSFIYYAHLRTRATGSGPVHQKPLILCLDVVASLSCDVSIDSRPTHRPRINSRSTRFHYIRSAGTCSPIAGSFPDVLLPRCRPPVSTTPNGAS